MKKSEADFLELCKDTLVPPGNGVFTVNTASDKKELLHQQVYQTHNQDEVLKSWHQQLHKLSEQKTCLLGICNDSGGGILRGANWGPLYIRLEILKDPSLAKDLLDLGDIRIVPHLLHDKYLNQETITKVQQALFKNSSKTNYPVSPLSLASFFLEQLYQTYPDKRVFTLGGDHSISYSAVKSYLKRNNKKKALIHFDAHTDLLPDRLGVDLCFGSWTYHILDDLKDSNLLYQIGIRSSAKDRHHWESTFNISQFWPNEIKQIGAKEIAQQIGEKLKQSNIEEAYISFDIDALDIKYASATGTPESSGLELHEAVLMIQEIAKIVPITGADLAEVAPFTHQPDLDQKEPETTLLSAQVIATQLLQALGST